MSTPLIIPHSLSLADGELAEKRRLTPHDLRVQPRLSGCRLCARRPCED